MSPSLQAVREAAVDGRLENTIYRQTQLESLHKVLVANAEAVERAIRKDSGHSDSEAAVEFILTLQAVKSYYETLDETAALDAEYAVARGEDAPQRRDRIGVVYLVPTTYTLFYSAVVATSAAVAAGNCVVIELGNTLREVPPLLRKLLKTALDPSIIEFVSSPASDDDLGPTHIRVFQDNAPATATQQSPSSPTIHPPLISLPDSRVLAIVDRGTNLAEAAAALVTARFSFAGNSPYAPDAVLVHEYVKKEFLVAVVEEMLKFTANLSTKSQAVDQDRAKRTSQHLEAGLKSGDLQATSSTPRGAIYEATSGKADILRRKITGTTLVVLGVRSLDDAIDLANHSGSDLLSTYLFAAPKAAKYLSQFIQAQSAFVNHVPLDLLVGPATPNFSPLDLSTRYPTTLLSTPHAEYVSPTPSTTFVSASLRATDSTAIVKALKSIAAPLTPKKARKPGGQIGFFEQGILTGLGMFGLPTLAAIGAAGWYGGRWVVRVLRG